MKLSIPAAFLLLLACPSCLGVFQETRPERPHTFHRVSAERDELLAVGAAEADITPAAKVYLAGFNPNRISTGVHLPLKARAIVFERGEMRIAVVGIDNLGLQRDDVEWIKSGLYGFQNGCVFLCSSHTHAAPDLVGIWGFYMVASGRSRDYLAQVRAGVQEAIERAAANARPAVLTRGEARVPPQGFVRNSNRGGLFDPRFTVISARDAESGEPLGTILHLGCHPEVLGRSNTLVSPDFVGPLCDGWREAGLGQAVFVNGTLGAMITPQPHGLEGIDTMTETLLAVAQRAQAAAESVAVDELEVGRSDLYMPLTSPGLMLGRLSMSVPRRGFGDQLCSTVGHIRLGGIEIACVPGEMEPTLGARLRQQLRRPNLLLFGLVDDELGYLMREVDAHDPLFAYERVMSPVVDAGERVVEALLATPATPVRADG